MRSDLDISWVRAASEALGEAGKPLDNILTWVDPKDAAKHPPGIGNQINDATRTNAVQHGGSATVGPRGGGPKGWDDMGKIGETGPVIEYGPNGITVQHAGAVNKYLLKHGRQHAAWYGAGKDSMLIGAPGGLGWLATKAAHQTWKDENGKK